MRILHPTGGRLSMRFNDLRLDHTDRVQVGNFQLTSRRKNSLWKVSIDIPLQATNILYATKVEFYWRKHFWDILRCGLLVSFIGRAMPGSVITVRGEMRRKVRDLLIKILSDPSHDDTARLCLLSHLYVLIISLFTSLWVQELYTANNSFLCWHVCKGVSVGGYVVVVVWRDGDSVMVMAVMAGKVMMKECCLTSLRE